MFFYNVAKVDAFPTPTLCFMMLQKIVIENVIVFCFFSCIRFWSSSLYDNFVLLKT